MDCVEGLDSLKSNLRQTLDMMTAFLTPPRGIRLSEVGDDVVLVDESGHAVGCADRATVHTDATPLHLAFSTYLFDPTGAVLVTRRALAKSTWPGVWTNSCCGHPRPDESVEEAVRCRVWEELGLQLGPIGAVPLLPDFRYRAVDASGIVEHEICPVYAGFVADRELAPDPEEVAEWAWVPWADLVAAVSATPQVYSPWVALQVPLIDVAFPGAHFAGERQRPEADVAAAVRDVDALLTDEIESLAEEWESYAGGLGPDILAEDLPGWLAELLLGRGKRVRVMMAYWGYLAAGGTHGTVAYRSLVRAAAAVEVLHLFALLHDDVMDESISRRGRPSAQIQAAEWHRLAGGLGERELFGRNLAVLLGDLAHTVADRLADGLPPELRRIWYVMSVELIAGQRADLTGAAAGRRDRAHAEHVAATTSGRYTVTRPLQLGAAAAGAPTTIVETLTAYGDHLGQAFALRDDYLGVWGDPAVTGKPAGDDLVEAKATVLLALAEERLTGRAAELLQRVGTAAFGCEDAAALAAAMRDAGIDTELDRLVSEAVTAGLKALDSSVLTSVGISGLRAAGRALAWRDA